MEALSVDRPVELLGKSLPAGTRKALELAYLLSTQVEEGRPLRFAFLLAEHVNFLPARRRSATPWLTPSLGPLVLRQDQSHLAGGPLRGSAQLSHRHYRKVRASSIQVGMESKVPPIPKHAEVEADPGVLARFNSSVIEEFRANGGVVGGPFEDSAIMLLTMTGAKSGQRRLTPLEYFQVDGRVIFVGTRGGAETNPAWVHNVRANPNVHVEIGAESYDAVARELSGDERDSVYAKVKELCPRILTYPVPARQIPVFELLRR